MRVSRQRTSYSPTQPCLPVRLANNRIPRFEGSLITIRTHYRSLRPQRRPGCKGKRKRRERGKSQSNAKKSALSGALHRRSQISSCSDLHQHFSQTPVFPLEHPCNGQSRLYLSLWSEFSSLFFQSHLYTLSGVLPD
ncbi:Hypothetical_protein [Hexamita inflata]|uniref:Hypothetical_protein n=1 Tax=Hexamita inflata TaxID=28002 RepID=A0AA86P8B4_9EUKA|nr:Hypothetical protein HINF_LOCUS21426 [Hexamita inflata]CAI9933801.1 Hypothetical protein HINF_LOCUS21446 [Hexamita inflata]CAI9933807.1 Hypothetical protein HINF_LOCUS21452 [Hexamita inflata]